MDMHFCINVTKVKKKGNGTYSAPSTHTGPRTHLFTVYVYAQVLAVGHELIFFCLGLTGLTDGGREIVSKGVKGTQWLRVPAQAPISPQTTFAICDINIKCPPAIRPRGLVWP